jgi:hypothetical protein
MTNEKREQKTKEALTIIQDLVTRKLDEEQEFTGKIVIELNCNSGGIGNIEAFVQRKL